MLLKRQQDSDTTTMASSSKSSKSESKSRTSIEVDTTKEDDDVVKGMHHLNLQSYFPPGIDFDSAKCEKILQPEFIRQIANIIPVPLLETRDAEELLVRYASTFFKQHPLADEVPEKPKDLVSHLVDMGFQEAFFQDRFDHVDESIFIHSAADWALRYIRFLLYRPHPADPISKSEIAKGAGQIQLRQSAASGTSK